MTVAQLQRRWHNDFAVAVLVGLLAGVGTLNVGRGLAAFVIVFLGFRGYEALSGLADHEAPLERGRQQNW